MNELTIPTTSELMATYFRFLRWVATIMALTCLMMFIYGTYFEHPYLRYQNLPFDVITERLEPGQIADFVVERCNDDKIKHQYKITHWLHPTNSNPKAGLTLPDIMMEPVDLEILPGCHRTVSKVNKIPLTTPPNKYIPQGYAIVEGKFHTFQIEWYAEEIEVVPAGGTKP
jgi:hypothetical protein